MIVLEIITGVVLWSVGCFALGFLFGGTKYKDPQ